MNCLMRTSLRLLGMAQRKNKTVTRKNGTKFPLGKSEGLVSRDGICEVAISALCQRPVQVHVAAIHKKMLAGNVPRLGRKEKYYHRRDLIRRGHPFFQMYLREDGLQLLVRIRESVEPLPIERSHNFGGDDSIYANPIFQQFRRPLARQGKNRAF